ncbi:hypothetical protein BH11PSE2_BH11PSE2_09450 [soil metagenome]
MFKVQIRQPGAVVWDLSGLPTSLLMASAQARNASAREPVSVRLAPSVAPQVVDVKV